MIKTRYIYQALYLSVLALFIQGCSSETGLFPPEEPLSTWEIIQTEILEPNCVSCHTQGTTFASQSGLVLTKEVAYTNLINVIPTNKSAADDGLKLLETDGVESLVKSFFWKKVNAPDQDHFYREHPDYGEIMPFGNQPLTNGELAYIREWIVNGAPENTIVANEDLLIDSSRFELEEVSFKVLEPPLSGIQLHLGPFDVKSNFERELYEYQMLGNTEDIFVERIQISMRQGSHHFILYDFADGADLPQLNEIRDIRDGTGQFNTATLLSLQNQQFIFGTQIRNTDYKYPKGVALRIPAGKALDLNSHYVNYSPNAIIGELYANLFTIDEAEVQHLAQKLFLNEPNFSLPPKQESTVHSQYIFDERRNIFMLTTHAHKHMKEFRIFINGGPRDGELVYFTDDWEHPLLLNYDPPIVLNQGEGLRGEALYDNNTDRTLSFGLLSIDEMMIIFGAYYVD